MKLCDKCNSDRVASIQGKCSDQFSMLFQGEDIQGEVPKNLNIGEGDYIEMGICMDCGKVQGKFPVTKVL